jgi:hypothetical protein
MTLTVTGHRGSSCRKGEGEAWYTSGNSGLAEGTEKGGAAETSGQI